MHRSAGRRGAAALVLSAIALGAFAAPVSAAAPTVDTWANHVERPDLSCDGFDAIGVWDISHKLTTWSANGGVPQRDTERVDFRGSFVNSVTGRAVPDSGSIIYFDTLNPDGSFATTMSNTVRHSAWIHGAGRRDWQTQAFHGTDGEDPTGVAALCAALAG